MWCLSYLDKTSVKEFIEWCLSHVDYILLVEVVHTGSIAVEDMFCKN